MKRFEVTVRASSTHVVHAHSVEAAEQAAFAMAMPRLRDSSWSPESVSAVMTGQVFAPDVETYRKKLLGMFQVIQEKEKKISHLISMDPRLDSDNMDELRERERWMNVYGERLDRIIERDEKGEK
jgi:hypothetical protein